MKRSTTLLLPLLLLVLASCGTTAQYSQQQFQDGIYAKPGEEPKVVHLYSEEDFEAMAAANIARKQQQGSRDTLVVVLDDPWGYSWRYPYSRWAWGGLGFGSFYWSRWRFGGLYDPWFYDPWYGYGFGWYDPWFYDPWFYDPWYGPGYYGYGWGYGWYDPWYGPYRPWHGGGWGPGAIHGNSVYTQRALTEAGGRREMRPGSGYNYRYGTPGSAGGSVIGSRSGSGTVRRSQSGIGTGTATGRSTSGSAAQRREQGYNLNRSYGNRSTQQSNTENNRATTRSYNNNTTTNYNSGASRSYGGGGGYSGGGYSGGGSYGGGGSSSHSGGGGGGSRGGGGRR